LDRPRPRIFGIPNRYFVLLFLILGFFAARIFPPVLPHIQVAPEVVTIINLPIVGMFGWTNTMTAMVVADVIMLFIAFAVRRAVRSGSLVPTGFSGAIEAVIEVLYNMTESTAGKWAKKIFPWFGAITVFVLIVNWTELIPGVDTVGRIEIARTHGNPVEEVLGNVYTLLPAEDNGEGGHEEDMFTLIPYVRTLSTDLNFTVALALISVTMTQIYGFQALGPGYFSKYMNVKALLNFFKNPMGIIDFGVGLLEIVSEISKILSFSFRLFGNIFAGTVLLFVIGTLVPVFAPTIFYLLEVFVGLIQAFVFGILTMVFMSQAMAGHGDH
jgi:F-type H+-transporting ATPase subunit a